jgi:quercetin dioxygenase-like cupin family protein
VRLVELPSRELFPGVTISGFGRTAGPAQVFQLALEPGGVIHGHEAPVPQLLVCVRGRGWTRSGEDGEPVQLDEGQAVAFDRGEWHETGSSEFMTVVVVETDEFERIA